MEDDSYATVTPYSYWPDGKFLGTSTPYRYIATYFGAGNFFVTTSGHDICGFRSAPNGLTFGAGSAGSSIIVADNIAYGEYRVSCGGTDLPNRHIAIYYKSGPAIVPQGFCALASCLENSWDRVSSLYDVKEERGVRIIVKNSGGTVEDDFYAVGTDRYFGTWPHVAPMGGIVLARKVTNVNVVNLSSTLVVTNSQACLSSSDGGDVIVSDTDTGLTTLRSSCGGAIISGKSVEVYKLKLSENTAKGKCACPVNPSSNECFDSYIGDSCYFRVPRGDGTFNQYQGNCSEECTCVYGVIRQCDAGVYDTRFCCEQAGGSWLPSGEMQGNGDNAVSATKVNSQFSPSGGTNSILPSHINESGNLRYVCTLSYPSAIIRTRECKDDACLPDPTNPVLCDKATDCVFNNVCYSDIKAVASRFFSSSIREVSENVWWPEVSADVNNNRQKLVCDPGEWTKFVGILYGTVTNTSGAPIVGAKVRLAGITDVFAITDSNGRYTIPDLAVGEYDVYVTHPLYQSASKADVYIHFSVNVLDVTTADFQLLPGSLTCNNDCTRKGTTICSAACDGFAACNFYDIRARDICDGQRAGFVKEYDSTRDIVCCDGSPYNKQNIMANFQVAAKHVARVVKAVQLPDGRLGKMIIYTFK